ncbi:MAG: lysophospholipid acyltransferase family protein [Thermoguttaceae bacterium]|nr:lysophospholipid acyltransferase family protein [Thermoguttaceae bacterium]
MSEQTRKKRWFHSVMDLAVYGLVRSVICAIQAVSLEKALSFADFLAWLCCRVLRIRHRLVAENLQIAFPKLDTAQHARIEYQSWRHLLMMLVEIAHAPRRLHDSNWRELVMLSNQEMRETVRYLLGDRPVLVVTGHLGNFEMGGVMLGLLGFPSYTIARRIDNPYIDRFINRFRGSTGQFILAKNGEFDKIQAVIGTGGTLSFLADHHVYNGCPAFFFGKPVLAHKVIALFSLEHHAPVIVCGTMRQERAIPYKTGVTKTPNSSEDGDRPTETNAAKEKEKPPQRDAFVPMQFEMHVEAVLDPDAPEAAGISADSLSVRSLTQWYTSALESMIRQHPTQYWWLHRRWREMPKRFQKK